MALVRGRLVGSRLAFAACAAAVAASVSLAFPTASRAVGACGSFATINNRGAATQTYEYQDVWSWIVTKSPQLCTGSPGGTTAFSLAWVMLASDDSADWAQVGPGNWGGGYGRQTTFQWTINGNPQPVVFHPAAAVGTAPSYEVTYVASSGSTRMIGNGYVEEIPVNPFTSWVRPVNAEVAGETNDCNSNMPGIQSSPEEFRDIAGVRYGGDIATLTDATLLSLGCISEGRYFLQWGTFPTLLQLWTYPA